MDILLLLSLVIISLSSRRLWRRHKVRRWQKAHALDKHDAVFQQLYAPIDSFALSQQARAKQDAFEYVYGEIEFIPFIALLSLAHPTPDTIFYDLGSGSGKAVLACAMVFDVKKSCGIELFETLYSVALDLKQKLSATPGYALQAGKIQFNHANFLQADFSDATLIFINATAFIGETWHLLNQRLAGLPGITVISTSKKLTASNFIVTHTTWVQMSWGVVQAFVHQQKDKPLSHALPSKLKQIDPVT